MENSETTVEEPLHSDKTGVSEAISRRHISETIDSEH
jgi:hypothetical protein